ncbi:MAG: FeoB-associated Cys-rich membrane protein [Proteobacteria bacterium]|nr:FeoB-associated Cys-rich membrane protein [Pseudomonadota bacterium]MBU1451940.1 FeoB-associated Cys-rich membrane protein [Pseudomonadota bacterium]MBU2467079.1 FeoB-associated Cys-rich membrane protein [Pseudomonadota bacterium]MBU2517128.1 FeoB-associated Cys-rich membrane protein [Pseudomonadota bacterium]
MWQGIIVAVAVGLAALWVGRRLYRSLRAAKDQSAGCGCGCQGPCHQPQPLPGPEPDACQSCLQKPDDIPPEKG